MDSRRRARSRSHRHQRSRHILRIAAAGMVLAFGLLVTAWCVTRSSGVHTHPSLATASRSEGETLSVRSVAFPEHRQMEVRLEGHCPEGTRIEVWSDSELLGVARADEGASSVLVEDLPPGRDVRVVAAFPGREGSMVPYTAHTPELVALQSMSCFPASTGVLVTFEPAAPADLTVQIGPWGGHAATIRREHRSSEPFFSEMIEGLQPDTDHFLSIRTRSGWGGLGRYRFRTHAARYRSRLRALLDHPGAPALDMFAGDGELWNEPDPTVLPALVALCTSTGQPHLLPMARLSYLARTFRSRELLDALVPLAEQVDEPEVAASLIETCLTLHHPIADELAERHFLTASPSWFLDICAAGLGHIGGTLTCDRLATRGEALDVAMSPRFLTSMVIADRSRAREHFTRWMRSSQIRLVESGIIGSLSMPEARDIESIANIVRGPPDRLGWSCAVGELARVKSRDAGLALSDALKANPRSEVLLRANACQGNRACRSLLEEAVARATSPEDRRDAVLAVGRLGDGLSAPALRACLADADPEVVQAACWALARIGDTAAVSSLEKLFEARVKGNTADDAISACLIAVALEKLNGPQARPVAALENGSPMVRDLARRVLARAHVGPGEVEFLVLPMMNRIPTGIRLCPGDCRDITATGDPDREIGVLLGGEFTRIAARGQSQRFVARTSGELVLASQPDDRPIRRRARLSGLTRVVIAR